MLLCLTLFVFHAVLSLLFFSSAGAYLYRPVWPSDSWCSAHTLIVIDFLASTMPFLLSIIYHTFMCHCGGPDVYTVLLKVDITGVWFVTTFGEVSIIYSSLYCTPWLNAGYMSWYFVLSVVVLWYFLSAKSKCERVFALTVQYAFRIVVLLLRVSPLGVGSAQSLWCYVTMECLTVPGALINACHIPERWLPGKVDYLFNGHTIMHMTSFMLMVMARKGFLLDMQWINGSPVCL